MFKKLISAAVATCFPATSANSCTIRVMKAGYGDQPIKINFDDPKSLAEANKIIADLKDNGASFFKEQPEGKGGEIIHNYVPKPGENVVAVPRIIGG